MKTREDQKQGLQKLHWRSPWGAFRRGGRAWPASGIRRAIDRLSHTALAALRTGERRPQQAIRGGETGLKTSDKFGLGAAGLLGVLTWLMTLPEPAPETAPEAPRQAQLKFAAVTPSARRDINYAALDERLKRLAAKPAVVGMAVGIVENGRITFLSGYGEELAGSGHQVTPQTVFRWASVSKGVAATMVAKLAEEGKLSLQAPVVRYAASRKMPGGTENRATRRPSESSARALSQRL